jgi:transposase
MPREQSLGKPTTRRYSPEEKAQAVRMVRQLRKELGTSQGTIKRVADQLGYGVESVRLWVKQAEIDAGEAPGTTTADAERMRRLEQENRELRRANEILRRASAQCFLRGGARPPTEVTVKFIDDNRHEFGVEPICRVLQVAPSTYYAAKRREARPSARALRDAVMMQVLVVLWVANRNDCIGHGLDPTPGGSAHPRPPARRQRRPSSSSLVGSILGDRIDPATTRVPGHRPGRRPGQSDPEAQPASRPRPPGPLAKL